MYFDYYNCYGTLVCQIPKDRNCSGRQVLARTSIRDRKYNCTISSFLSSQFSLVFTILVSFLTNLSL